MLNLNTQIKGQAGAGESPLRLLGRSLTEDTCWAWQSFYLNSVAGSRWMPRALRWMLYRAYGLRIETPNIFAGNVFTGGREISIGRGTFMNVGSYFEAVAPITIGARCHIAMQVIAVTSDHPFTSDGEFSRHRVGRPITVGDDCWIGARAMLLPGVNIGDRVVIAAGSVVTRDCESGGLYAGNPARRIRELSSSERLGAG